MAKSSLSIMDGVLAFAIGLIAVIIVFGIIPTIGETTDGISDLPADSDWNATYNTDLKTGADLWEDTNPILVLAVLVGVFGLILGVVKKFRA